MKILHTKSELETFTCAKKVARRLKGGDIVLLEGELGSGKTTFVRGLAAAFGIRERITSPTFVLIHVHRVAKCKERRAKSISLKTLCPMPYALCYLVHVDAYRVKRARELKDAGLLDWLGKPDTVTVIEWGEKIKPLLRGRRYIVIQFQHERGPNGRKIITNFQFT